MCKPVLPLIQDELAHIFWKARHLATVHHHHGDHHAEAEIAEVEHDENGDKQPAATKTSEPVSVHIVNREIIYEILQLYTSQQEFSVTIWNVASISLDKYYPPPRV